jgi:hypothetical protein
MSITPERWRRIETVYLSAAEQPAERRAAWLAETCGEDTDLRQEVESLLTQDTSAAAMLDRGAEAAASALNRNAGVSLAPGRRIAHYEILVQVGAGGMGEVYRARDGKLGRDVAIKILPCAFTEDPVRLARFGREARVLAFFNHPNIARPVPPDSRAAGDGFRARYHLEPRRLVGHCCSTGDQERHRAL